MVVEQLLLTLKGKFILSEVRCIMIQSNSDVWLTSQTIFSLGVEFNVLTASAKCHLWVMGYVD
jgi:hypothetical protein